MGRLQAGELTTPGARGITMCKLHVAFSTELEWKTANAWAAEP